MDQVAYPESEIASAILAMYRARDRLFRDNIFTNPGWDILLSLCKQQDCCDMRDFEDEFPFYSREILERWVALLTARSLIFTNHHADGSTDYGLSSRTRRQMAAAMKALDWLPIP